MEWGKHLTGKREESRGRNGMTEYKRQKVCFTSKKAHTGENYGKRKLQKFSVKGNLITQEKSRRRTKSKNF